MTAIDCATARRHIPSRETFKIKSPRDIAETRRAYLAHIAHSDLDDETRGRIEALMNRADTVLANIRKARRVWQEQRDKNLTA